MIRSIETGASRPGLRVWHLTALVTSSLGVNRLLRSANLSILHKIFNSLDDPRWTTLGEVTQDDSCCPLL